MASYLDNLIRVVSSFVLCLPLGACVPSSGIINIANNFVITSPPSTCFQSSNSNPILTKDSIFTGSDWNDPSVIKMGGDFIMFASSDLNLDINVKIYRLVSAEGTNWSLSPSDPVLSPSVTASDWDHRSVETPSVVFFNSSYHMFYTGYPNSYKNVDEYRIGHATSSDSVTWTKDSSPLIFPSDINATIIGEPGAAVFNSKIYLYFTAVVNNQQVIALQTFDGSSWTSPIVVLSKSTSVYSASRWFGFSTPQPAVISSQIHLFFDVINADPWRQDKIHRAISTDGLTSWTFDSTEIFDRHNFNWTYNQIRSPAPLVDGSNLYLWFAGEMLNPTRLSIGLATCPI